MSEKPKEKKAIFVIFQSKDGLKDWSICKHEDIPDWVLTPDNLGMMTLGQMCARHDIPSLWYRAEVGLNAWDRDKLATALRARAQRQAEALMMLPEKRVTVETSELLH